MNWKCLFSITLATAPALAAQRPVPVAKPGPLSGILGFLIALAMLAGAAVLAVRALRSRGVTAESALQSVGIRLPDEPEEIPVVPAPAPPPPDPTICPFCGARKEPGGPCAQCEAPAGAGLVAPRGPGRLVAIEGPRAGESFPLSGPLTIGRDPSRDITLPDDPLVSRQHAAIEVGPSGPTLVDSGSSNGTFVNGQRVQRHVLRPGDVVTAGSSRFRYEA